MRTSPARRTPWYGDKSQSTLWHENKPAANRIHPTSKPVELVERALLNSSKAGDVVADLFGGSGSTLIACERRNRKSRLMEIDPPIMRRGRPTQSNRESGIRYCERANKRGQPEAKRGPRAECGGSCQTSKGSPRGSGQLADHQYRTLSLFVSLGLGDIGSIHPPRWLVGQSDPVPVDVLAECFEKPSVPRNRTQTHHIIGNRNRDRFPDGDGEHLSIIVHSNNRPEQAVLHRHVGGSRQPNGRRRRHGVSDAHIRVLALSLLGAGEYAPGLYKIPLDIACFAAGSRFLIRTNRLLGQLVAIASKWRADRTGAYPHAPRFPGTSTRTEISASPDQVRTAVNSCGDQRS